MEKEILTINDLDKAISFQTEEEASKYLYEAQLVKEICKENYKDGFADGYVSSLANNGEKHIRKKNMCQYEPKGGNIMEKDKKIGLMFAGFSAGATAFAGICSGIYQLYQLHITRKSVKAQNEEQTNQDSENK